MNRPYTPPDSDPEVTVPVPKPESIDTRGSPPEQKMQMLNWAKKGYEARGRKTPSQYAEWLLSIRNVLKSHLPYSLPVLRRIEAMDVPGGKSEFTRVICEPAGELREGETFMVAFVDLSCGPETEMFVYSSSEDPESGRQGGKAQEVDEHKVVVVVEEQFLGLLRRVRMLEKEYYERRTGAVRAMPGVVLIGSLHDKLLSILQRRGELVKTVTSPHYKFVFRRENLPIPKILPEDMEFGVVNESDLPLVLSRTDIPRKIASMKILPSVAIRVKGEEAPIAWGFIALDGSLRTLHCEERYRGRGLAKAVALKLFMDEMEKEDGDGFVHADVGTENLASAGVCRSLGGKEEWIDYWCWVKLDELDEAGLSVD